MKQSYTVKNYLWVLILLMFLIVMLAGCSSPPKKMAKPFCHTAKEVRVKDGQTVSSETLVSCNDDPIEQINIKRAGISKRCFNDTQSVQLPSGRIIVNEAFACQKPDGSWIHIPAN